MVNSACAIVNLPHTNREYNTNNLIYYHRESNNKINYLHKYYRYRAQILKQFIYRNTHFLHIHSTFIIYL